MSDERAAQAAEQHAAKAAELGITPQRLARMMAVLARRQPRLTVLMDQVNKPHNFSAILRTCDAVGVLEAHAVPPSRTGVLPYEEAEPAGAALPDLSKGTYSATSGSAAKWVGVHTHADTVEAVREMQQRGFQVLATHLSENARDYREADYTRPTCVLLGAEKFGVSLPAAQAADANIVIPMFGMVQSLNVSVAAATILFEAQRQRLAAGMYQQPQLSQAEMDELAQRWASR